MKITENFREIIITTPFNKWRKLPFLSIFAVISGIMTYSVIEDITRGGKEQQLIDTLFNCAALLIPFIFFSGFTIICFLFLFGQ